MSTAGPSRYKSAFDLNADVQLRLDKALVTTEVPLKILSERFQVTMKSLHERLDKVFGLKALRECKETGTQERVEI